MKCKIYLEYKIFKSNKLRDQILKIIFVLVTVFAVAYALRPGVVHSSTMPVKNILDMTDVRGTIHFGGSPEVDTSNLNIINEGPDKVDKEMMTLSQVGVSALKASKITFSSLKKAFYEKIVRENEILRAATRECRIHKGTHSLIRNRHNVRRFRPIYDHLCNKAGKVPVGGELTDKLGSGASTKHITF